MASKGITFKDIKGNNIYPCPYYPVGSIYMSVNNINPSKFFGGKWEQIQDKFLLGCGASHQNGETGGEESHTLTVEELPSHDHKNIRLANQFYITAWNDYKGDAKAFNIDGDYRTDATNYGDAVANSFDTGSTGSDEPHNNMPPYLAVYIWKRIA